MVLSSFFAGAEMMTFFAPASRCAFAFVASVKKPVDSMTMSMSRSFHGSFAGSRSWMTLIFRPSTTIESAVADTSPLNVPYVESCLKRWAFIFGSARSFIATISSSGWRSRTALRNCRPMRPKPLMAIRADIPGSPFDLVKRRAVRASLLKEPVAPAGRALARLQYSTVHADVRAERRGHEAHCRGRGLERTLGHGAMHRHEHVRRLMLGDGSADDDDRRVEAVH